MPTIRGAKKKYVQISTGVSPQFYKKLKLQAFKEEKPMGEILEIYQKFYFDNMKGHKET